jgi:hypothetical protein
MAEEVGSLLTGSDACAEPSLPGAVAGTKTLSISGGAEHAPLHRTTTSTAIKDIAGGVLDEEDEAPSRCACMAEGLKKQVCGFQVPQLLMLLASVGMPSLDAASDWAVTISFYANGDMNWFRIALMIQLVGGCVCGLLFALMIHEDKFEDKRCGKLLAFLLGQLVGIAGLAPICVALLALKLGASGDESKGKEMIQLLKIFKGCELVFEALPQSLLQTYVGTSYGQLNPSGDDFNPLLAGSVALSMVSGGSSILGLEFEARNSKSDVTLRIGSRYGFTTLMLRASQMASIVFWIALLGCGVKQPTVIFAVLAVMLFLWFVMETIGRDSAESMDSKKQRCFCICMNPVTGCCTGDDEDSCPKLVPCHKLEVVPGIKGAVILNTYHLLLVGAMAFYFFKAPHVPNNYAAYPNMTAEVGLPGDLYEDNYFDCRERTSGLYPALLGTVMSLVFCVLSPSMDPKYGAKRCMGLSYEERRERRYQRAIAGLTQQQVTLAEMQAIWRAFDINHDGVLGELDGELWIKQTAVDSSGDYDPGLRRFTDYAEMCEEMGTGTSKFIGAFDTKPATGPTKEQFMLWYGGLTSADKPFVPSENMPGAPFKRGQIIKVVEEENGAARFAQLLADTRDEPEPETEPETEPEPGLTTITLPQVGQKLEAQDLKNLNLTCVATVKAVEGEGADAKVTVTFDGWPGDTYDYTETVTFDGFHPVGWCEANDKPLQAPGSEATAPEDGWPTPFDWPAYLASTDATAVDASSLPGTTSRVAPEPEVEHTLDQLRKMFPIGTCVFYEEGSAGEQYGEISNPVDSDGREAAIRQW